MRANCIRIFIRKIAQALKIYRNFAINFKAWLQQGDYYGRPYKMKLDKRAIMRRSTFTKRSDVLQWTLRLKRALIIGQSKLLLFTYSVHSIAKNQWRVYRYNFGWSTLYHRIYSFFSPLFNYLRTLRICFCVLYFWSKIDRGGGRTVGDFWLLDDNHIQSRT